MLVSTEHQHYFDKWQLGLPTKSLETEWSILYWCAYKEVACVLKIYKENAVEAGAAALLLHFDGNGIVRVLEHCDTACVIEQVGVGREVVELTRQGKDREATEVLCDVIKKLHSNPTKNIDLKPIDDFIADFDDYLARDNVAERQLVEKARSIYIELAASQGQKIALHGDLHHYNILQAAGGEWLAIDPKGYFGEAEYELGAFLRNPLPDDYANIDVAKRLEVIEATLGYDMQRIKKWAFCQAILAAIWGDAHIEFAPSMLKIANLFNDE